MADACGNPAADSESLMPRRKKYDKSKLCVKCKERTGNLIIRHAVYCKECFVPLMTFKFRRSLEPHVNAKPDGPRRTALKPQGNLLIGYSGGLGSTVLLDLVHRYYVAPDKALITDEGGSNHPRNERVWKRVIVCYVEVCDAFPSMREKTAEIRAVVERYGDLEFVPLRVQDVFDDTWWKTVGRDSVPLEVDLNGNEMSLSQQTGPTNPLDALRSYIISLPTTTARTTALQTLTRVLLQYTALSKDGSHLVLGTSLTSLAVSLISGVAHGGGFHVKEEIQEEWTPDAILPTDQASGSKKNKSRKHGLRMIRPLRDVGMKECGAWAWWQGLTVVGRESWTWPNAKPGIGALTKAFIAGLEKDYPSTVSTIVRTCGKLAPKGSISGRCISCERPIQEGSQEWRTRISVVSRDDPNRLQPSSEDILRSLSSHLCYTCHTAFSSKSSRPPTAPYAGFNPPSRTPLPLWMGRTAETSNADNPTIGDGDILVSRKMSHDEMRDVVKGFLLVDE